MRSDSYYHPAFAVVMATLAACASPMGGEEVEPKGLEPTEEVLLTSAVAMTLLHATDDHVYFLHGNRLMALGIADRDLQDLRRLDLCRPGRAQVADQVLYFADCHLGQPRIMRVALHDPAAVPETLATLDLDAADLTAFHVTEAAYIARRAESDGTGGQQIYRLPLEGGAPVVIGFVPGRTDGHRQPLRRVSWQDGWTASSMGHSYFAVMRDTAEAEAGRSHLDACNIDPMGTVHRSLEPGSRHVLHCHVLVSGESPGATAAVARFARTESPISSVLSTTHAYVTVRRWGRYDLRAYPLRRSPDARDIDIAELDGEHPRVTGEPDRCGDYLQIDRGDQHRNGDICFETTPKDSSDYPVRGNNSHFCRRNLGPLTEWREGMGVGPELGVPNIFTSIEATQAGLAATTSTFQAGVSNRMTMIVVDPIEGTLTFERFFREPIVSLEAARSTRCVYRHTPTEP